MRRAAELNTYGVCDIRGAVNVTTTFRSLITCQRSLTLGVSGKPTFKATPSGVTRNRLDEPRYVPAAVGSFKYHITAIIQLGKRAFKTKMKSKPR